MNAPRPLRYQRLDRELTLLELALQLDAFDGEGRPDPTAIGLIERGLITRPALLKRLQTFYKAHPVKKAQVAR